MMMSREDEECEAFRLFLEEARERIKHDAEYRKEINKMLVDIGMYTEDGKLTKRYGGEC